MDSSHSTGNLRFRDLSTCGCAFQGSVLVTVRGKWAINDDCVPTWSYVSVTLQLQQVKVKQTYDVLGLTKLVVSSDIENRLNSCFAKVRAV